MRMIRRGLMAVTMVGIMGLGWSDRVMAAGPTPAQQCESKKNQAAGAKATCLAKGHAAAAEGRTYNVPQCETNFTNAFSAAEQKAGPGVCPTEGDTAAIEAMVHTCMRDIASALAGSPPPAPCPSKLLATGQTKCANIDGNAIPCVGTGQDGEFRTGAALSYTDNGDGTITDNNTGLTWEKKSGDGSIHNRDIFYFWGDAFAVHIAGLNTAAFAGHTDWRLPNIRELQSIVNYGNRNPAVSPVFNTECVPGCTVLTCSCQGATPGGEYWSSTIVADISGAALYVSFFAGGVDGASTSNEQPALPFRVRAVRGGL